MDTGAEDQEDQRRTTTTTTGDKEMSKLIKIQVIDYKRKMFFINLDYVVELAQCDDDTFYVQLTTEWYSIDKQSFESIRKQLQETKK